MAEQASDASPQRTGQGQAVPDLLSLWRDWAARAEEQWNKYFNELMSNEPFAASMGRSMDAMLAAQSRLAQQTEPVLRAWNVPTRTDIAALGERLALIEERLDGLQEALDELRSSRRAPWR